MSTLLDENLTCEFKRKNSFTLSKSCMKTEKFLWTVKSSLYPQLNIEELDHKAKEKLTSLRIRCGFFSNVFRVVEKLWAVFTPRRNYSTQHKLLKPWSLPENEFSELWRTFINFSWLPLTLASSLDVEQVRFASWSFTAFCLETTFLISQPFQFFRKSTMLALFVFKSKM